MTATPTRIAKSPELAAWSEFLKGIGVNAAYSRGNCLHVLGGRPLLLVCTLGADQARLEKALGHTERLANSKEWTGDLIVVGSHPLPEVLSYLDSDPPAGLIGQRVRPGHVLDPLAPEDGPPRLVYRPAGWQWSAALWHRCDTCGRLGVYAETGSWTTRPCGHDSGPWHCNDDEVPAISEAWGRASYAVNKRRSARARQAAS